MKRRRFLKTVALAQGALAVGQQPPAKGNVGNIMTNRYLFSGGTVGAWKVTEISAPRGGELEAVESLDVSNGARLEVPGTKWVLQGFTSNVRYAKSTEVASLKARQPALNRPEATCAALIPIKKSARWWDLAQDQRRAIFEENSHHTAIGLEYLPAIARRLHHCRDIGEPFDFLTWFEFAPRHKQAFNELVARLRATKEWEFVEREVDIRLERV